MKLRSDLSRLSVNSQGSVAVEFAFVAPVLLLLTFGIFCFGLIFATYNGVQQLAAEGARATVAGISASERDQLARAYITNNVGAYGVLDPSKITVTTNAQPNAFQVSVAYDLSSLPIFQFAWLVPLPSPTVTRSASVLLGGF